MRLSVYLQTAVLALGLALPGCTGGDQEGMDDPVQGEALDAGDAGGDEMMEAAPAKKKGKKGKKGKRGKKRKGKKGKKKKSGG